MPLYNLRNSRTEAQRRKMEDLEARGVCLFCPENLVSEESQEVVLSSPHWLVTPNEYPYAGTKLHLLMIPKQHASDLLDLSPDALSDFWTVLGQLRETYHLDYYGLGARNGDCSFTGGTIEHVHVHVIVGDVEAPGHQPVRLKLSSAP
jgi:ATP adenylyltransferase